MMPIDAGIITIFIWVYVVLEKLPISQKVIAGNLSPVSATYFISDVSALKIEDTIMIVGEYNLSVFHTHRQGLEQHSWNDIP